MIRWKPTTPASTQQRWQSREEILKAHLNSLSPDELRRVRPSYYWLRFGLPAWQRKLARKYDPDQPRVPAGNPDGGQWAGGESSADTNSDIQPASYRLAARGPQSEAYCWNQLLIDNMYCGSLRPSPVVAACRSQAMQRYAACLSGKPLPPLPF